MAKSYVKFEVTKEVSDKALEAVRLARQGGTVRKGINEVTKSVERGLASLVVIAGDIEPEEVVMHLPGLCDQKHITYVFVPTKQDLGKAIGMNITCSSVAIEKAGEAEPLIREVASKVTGKAAPEHREKKEERPSQKPEKKQKDAPKADEAKQQ